RFIQPDDRGHAPSSGLASLLHEPATLADNCEPILKRHRTRCRERGKFAQRQSGRRVELQPRHAFLEQLERNPADEEYARLGILGLRQLRFGAFEANFGEVKSEQAVRLIEPFSRRWKLLSHVSPHPDALRTLSGEKQRSLAHEIYDLRFHTSGDVAK